MTSKNIIEANAIAAQEGTTCRNAGLSEDEVIRIAKRSVENAEERVGRDLKKLKEDYLCWLSSGTGSNLENVKTDIHNFGQYTGEYPVLKPYLTKLQAVLKRYENAVAAGRRLPEN